MKQNGIEHLYIIGHQTPPHPTIQDSSATVRMEMPLDCARGDNNQFKFHVE